MDIFIALSRIIWAFDLSTPDNLPINEDPETAFVGVNLRRPRPFKMGFSIRSEAKQRIIEAEMKALSAEGGFFGNFGISKL
jgi:hypothetical protein